ncbi:retrotransposon protein, putative, ty1-copia subclass [Tanacetum coccineum]
MHDMGKTVNELHAMLKLHKQTLPKRDAPSLHAIRAGKVKKKKNKYKKPQLAARGNNKGKGKSKLAYAPNPNIPPPPKKEDTAKDSGFRRSRKLKLGALTLYMGNGQHATVKAIRSYDLCFPSGLVLVLHNCHYAPSIARGVILVSHLYDDGFINHFENDNSILVSKDNLIYFNVVPRDGIFEIVLFDSNTNVSSMYAVSNKRAKLNLDSSLLWHCRLGHISKKHIEKLQQDGLLNSSESNFFWDYALESIVRILNMVPIKKVEKTPYEVWYGQAPKLSYLKVWGCEEPRSTKCIFVGYPKETIGYSFYYPPKNKVFVARNVEFFNNSLIIQEASGSLEDLEIIQEEDMHPFKNTSSYHDEDNQEIDEPQSNIIPIRRSTRTQHAPNKMCLNIEADEYELGDLNKPANYKVALSDPEFNKWLNAMNVEMKSMKDNEVWDLVDLCPNRKTVGSK